MPISSEDWTFGRATLTPSGRLHLLSFPRTADGTAAGVTQVIGWSPGDVTSFMIPWEAKDIGYGAEPEPHGLILGPLGEVLLATSDGTSEELVDRSANGPTALGVLRCLRVIGHHAYAAGMGRQVYRREWGTLPDGRSGWTHQDEGVVVRPPSDAIVGFNSLDGFSEEEIYAVGWQGEIGWRSRGIWTLVTSPTNLKLESVVCGGDGVVYAAGQNGVLVKGREGRWSTLDQDDVRDQFWGAEWYRDRLWLATSRSVFVLEGGALRRIGFGAVDEPTCGWLTADSEKIWSIGPSHVFFSHDGDHWEQVVF